MGKSKDEKLLLWRIKDHLENLQALLVRDGNVKGRNILFQAPAVARKEGGSGISNGDNNSTEEGKNAETNLYQDRCVGVCKAREASQSSA